MKKFIFSLSLLALLSSCESDSVAESESNAKTTNDSELSSRIRIKFMIGIGANLEKPRLGCKDGWGICEVRIGIASIGVERMASTSFGVSSDDFIYVKFLDNRDIEDRVMRIESGDEIITISRDIVNEFARDGYDISRIKLTPGSYRLEEDENNVSFVKIPFQRY